MSDEKKSATLAEVLSSTAATLAAVKEMQDLQARAEPRLQKLELQAQLHEKETAHQRGLLREMEGVQGGLQDGLKALEDLQAQLGMRLHELEDRSSFDVLTPAAKVGVAIGGFMAVIIGGAAAAGLAGRVFDAARGADGVTRGHELQKLMLAPSPVILADGRVIDRDGVVPAGASGGDLLGAAALGAIVGASAAN